MRAEVKKSVPNSISRMAFVALSVFLQVLWIIALVVRVNEYYAEISILPNVFMAPDTEPAYLLPRSMHNAHAEGSMRSKNVQKRHIYTAHHSLFKNYSGNLNILSVKSR